MTIDVKTDPVQPGPGVPPIVQVVVPRRRDPLEAGSRRPLLGRPAFFRPGELRALLPLLVVLAAQAALSLRLSNTAFEDEALTLFSGHQEIRVLLHGAVGTPAYATYFSGAPFLYPVLAAAVDGHFGLEGARVLSLVFMLGTTSLLWSAARALFGRPAALGAVMVFGLAGPTLFLGHFAVYDAPAVFLYAASLRIVIATARRGPWSVLYAVPTTVLAIATSYATALFLPVLALAAGFIAATAGPRSGGRLRHLARGVLFVVAVAAAVEGWLALLGPAYRRGLETTLIDRNTGSDGFGRITGDSLQWGAAALVLGLLGTLAVARRHRDDPRHPHNVAAVLLTFTLALSVAVAPAYQAHIHTMQSLQKHIVVGLLFSAMAAGVAVSIPMRAARRARTRYAVAALTAVPLAAMGAAQSGKLFDYWPDSAPLITALTHDIGKGGGHYLAETSAVPQYYTAKLGGGASGDWENTFSFGYIDAAGNYVSGLPAYRQAIAERYFKLIVLSYDETSALDKAIDGPLKAHEGYRLVSVIRTRDAFGPGGYDVWEAER